MVDTGGSVSVPGYQAMATQLNKAAGIEYRYGKGTAAAGTSTTYAGPAANKYPASSRFTNMVWQVGSYDGSSEGDYSTTMGQVSWLPDNPTQYLGVSTFELLAQRSNTFSESPQLSWVLAPGLDDPATKASYRSLIPAGVQTNPVAMGRCYGRLTWCAQTIMAFQNGLLATTGSNTADNRTTAQLGAGKVPTAVAVTNGGEFALVTVWDTVNLKGQVALVALAGGCKHCPPGGSYWGEWTSIVPGLPNLGNIAFMKVIGYVDLPDMIAPTEISVTTGMDNEQLQRVYPPGRCADPFTSHEQLPLTVEANRQTFMAGACNYNTNAHGGVAVVLSKSEGKVAFVNLKPLFDYYQSMYFGTSANFQKTLTVGQEPAQWPLTFEQAPAQKPTVIKTIVLADKKRPTAVKAALYSTQRAWVATEDGTLQIYSLGNYASNGSAVPGDIALTGSVPIGKNPTALAYVKHDPAERTVTLNNNVIVVSRGDKKIQWVHFNADRNSGSIRREFQDSRLKDPVWAEDADNHGTESFVLTVADYEGRQVLNYRYGPITFLTNTGTNNACASPCGMAQSFEFGGAYALPGKAYQITGANVP
ncbi:hypothetical protein QTH87_17255 [Variovorax sp. J22P168]|uniref:hypothetical protein n=1 Tax=Variovorax jilinensis TaxID=3053513 RepID=UPI0025769AB5|nr:hypothetical protein [Variovorax sp. J22P168]MDM0014189.1 hypothetical protein [Variovorax sp. J22P168]